MSNDLQSAVDIVDKFKGFLSNDATLDDDTARKMVRAITNASDPSVFTDEVLGKIARACNANTNAQDLIKTVNHYAYGGSHYEELFTRNIDLKENINGLAEKLDELTGVIESAGEVEAFEELARAENAEQAQGLFDSAQKELKDATNAAENNPLDPDLETNKNSKQSKFNAYKALLADGDGRFDNNIANNGINKAKAQASSKRNNFNYKLTVARANVELNSNNIGDNFDKLRRIESLAKNVIPNNPNTDDLINKRTKHLTAGGGHRSLGGAGGKRHFTSLAFMASPEKLKERGVSPTTSLGEAYEKGKAIGVLKSVSKLKAAGWAGGAVALGSVLFGGKDKSPQYDSLMQGTEPNAGMAGRA